MSDDGQWLVLGVIDEIKEFMECAPYGHNHRRIKPEDSLSFPVASEASFSFSLAERGVREMLNVLEEESNKAKAREAVRRLFKPLPHIG